MIRIFDKNYFFYKSTKKKKYLHSDWGSEQSDASLILFADKMSGFLTGVQIYVALGIAVGKTMNETWEQWESFKKGNEKDTCILNKKETIEIKGTLKRKVLENLLFRGWIEDKRKREWEFNMVEPR